MNTIEKKLAQLPFLILDGAMATELERKDADLNDLLWSAKVLMEKPELIRSVHLDYLNAGADIICTATYQATFEGFKKRRLTFLESKGLFKLSVDLAKAARADFLDKNKNAETPLIAGSIGPYGAFLADGSEYNGQYKIGKVELKNFHRYRMEWLAECGIDLFIFETFPSLLETQAIMELLDKMDGVPALFSFSCKNDQQISDGHLFSEAAILAAECEWIAAVGINCLNPLWVNNLFDQLNGFEKPLLAYPNDGKLWDAQNKCWLPAHIEIEMEQLWAEWLDKKMKVMGGCCNTSPSYIGQLADFRKKI